MSGCIGQLHQPAWRRELHQPGDGSRMMSIRSRGSGSRLQREGKRAGRAGSDRSSRARSSIELGRDIFASSKYKQS
jgi:hypothetical protein